MVRSTNYNKLWQVALYEEKMKLVCGTMTVEDLWRLWIISGRYTTEGVHKRNISAIRFELRARGFTVTPDSELVITIPPTVQAKKKEVKQVLKAMLKHSDIYKSMISGLMQITRVVQQNRPKLGMEMQSTKHWIQQLDKGKKLKCRCKEYSEFGLPMRHGHIFVPSWQYRGPYRKTVNVVMQSRVRGGITTGSVVTAVRKAWLRCLPADMLPNDFYYQEEAKTKHLVPSKIDWQSVQQCK